MDNTIQINKALETTKALPQSALYLSDMGIANRYGVSRQTVWRWHRHDKTFPKPLKLSAGSTRWKLSDLEAWELLK